MSKKLLYLTTRLPYPVIGGDRLRMYNNLRELKALGYDITLVSLVAEDDNLNDVRKHNEFYTTFVPVEFHKKWAYLNAVKAVFNDKPFIVEYFYNSKMQKVVDKLLKENQYDVISGYTIRVAPYLEKYKDKNIILDMVDAISMMYKRRILNVKSIFDKFKIGIEFLKVKNYEKKCTKIFKKQVLISETDKLALSEFTNVENISIITNAVDTAYYTLVECEKKNNISFVGSMQYIPNSEAAMYFATAVFPIIKKQVPDAKFKIVGANPRKDLLDAVQSIEGVEVTGRVEDVREYMKDCKVSVCPVKIAGGVQNKILEAMAMGLPVVTTKEGAEGIGADENILQITKTNEEYAKKVIELMQNNELAKIISEKSRKFIIQNFSWQKVGDKWNMLMQEVTNA